MFYAWQSGLCSLSLSGEKDSLLRWGKSLSFTAFPARRGEENEVICMNVKATVEGESQISWCFVVVSGHHRRLWSTPPILVTKGSWILRKIIDNKDVLFRKGIISKLTTWNKTIMAILCTFWICEYRRPHLPRYKCYSVTKCRWGGRPSFTPR